MSKHYALILGASSGFGKAISLALAGDGVGILGVHLDRASTKPDVDKIIEDIRAKGVEAHFFNVNAADAGKERTEHISCKARAVDVHAGQPRRAHVLADGEHAAAIDGALQHHGQSDADDQHEDR